MLSVQVEVSQRQKNHSSAWERVPAKPDSIPLFDITPLIFQPFVVHIEIKIGESSMTQSSAVVTYS